MLGLDAFRRKPRKFDYKPVHFDPQKEAREQRKQELLGADAIPENDNNEYYAGKYIRQYGFSRKKTQMTDRGLGKEQRRRNITRGVIALVLLFIVAGYIILG